MTEKRKDQIRALLKAIETGDEAAVAVVSTEKYIQHNPQTHEGGEGLAALFKRLSKSSPRVNIVRAFSDGDYVFAHTEYFFSRDRVGFEVFRFEGDLAVEHWDNIQSYEGPNESGRTMVDGTIEASDPELTEVNRARVREFVECVLVAGQIERGGEFVDVGRYAEHHPRFGDDLVAFRAALSPTSSGADAAVSYRTLHRVLADGSFVLAVSEGSRDGVHSSFYDLFRIDDGMIVEHWNTTEHVPPQSEWKNDNGKF